MNKFYKVKNLALASSLCAAAFAAGVVVQKGLESGFGYNFPVIAKAEAQSERKGDTRKLPGLSESVMKKLGVITEHVSPDEEKSPGKKPNLAKALEELEKMERDCAKSCNNYEKGQMYRFFAFVYYSKEDYPRAIKAYKDVVAQSPGIPIAVELDALNALSQLTYATEKYDESIAYLDKWIALAGTVPADKYALRGQIYYTKGDKTRALQDISKAISMTEANGKPAKEPWYNLELALVLDKEDYKSGLVIIEKLIKNYSQPKYWSQYSGVSGMLGREDNQLHALDAVYVQNALEKSQDYLNLAYLYLGKEVPHKAALVLEKGMQAKVVERNVKNLKVLAGAWRQAQDYKKSIEVIKEAITVAAKEDAEKKNDSKYVPEQGNLVAELAGLYGDLDDAKNVVETGKKALSLGNLKRPCELHTNMGISYVDMRQYKSAIDSFEKARQDKQCRAIVSNWIRYAESEQKKKEALEES